MRGRRAPRRPTRWPSSPSTACAGWSASPPAPAEAPTLLVRRAVLVREAVLAVDVRHRDVVVGVNGGFARRAVADLEIDDVAAGFVHEVMRVAGAGAKARAHAGRERRAALVGDERRMAFDDVDELVLLGVRVSQ